MDKQKKKYEYPIDIGHFGDIILVEVESIKIPIAKKQLLALISINDLMDYIEERKITERQAPINGQQKLLLKWGVYSENLL